MEKFIFSSEQIKQIASESPCFAKILHEKRNNPLEFWRNEIRKNFPHGQINKVPAIKWLRDSVENNKDWLLVFGKNGYNFFISEISGVANLTLAGAKHFVESCYAS